jgi:hypothetical protein
LLVHGDMKQHCSELWPRFLAPETSVWKADNLLSSYITFLSKPMLLNFFIISRYVFVGKKIS